MNEDHRPETKAEADRARDSQYERIVGFILGGVGFLANKPARYLLTLMVIVTFSIAGYLLYWQNQQNIRSSDRLQILQTRIETMQETHYKEMNALRGEYYKFVTEDHSRMVNALEENTKAIKDTNRAVFRFEQALDKMKL